jgi:hypothetical protein
VWAGAEGSSVQFAGTFPTSRVEQVSPGHLVAIATGPTDSEAVALRCYDAVRLGLEGIGSVRLWEPTHGEVIAQPRESYEQRDLRVAGVRIGGPSSSRVHPAVAGTCMWQEGGPYTPGTTNTFGGTAKSEYGKLRAIPYPASLLGTITKRFNGFRRDVPSLACPAK